jgi:hypothetical protein
MVGTVLPLMIADIKRVSGFWGIQKCGYVGEITSFKTQKTPVLKKVYLYVHYSGSPALRKALIINSLSA